MRILIVDDEATSREVLKRMLRSYGECEAASSGEDAYREFILAHGAMQPFSLITLDIAMGGIDGNETARRIRRWEDAYRVHQCSIEAKLLVITSGVASVSPFRSFRQGAEAYVKKPVDAEALENVLLLLGVNRSAA